MTDLFTEADVIHRYTRAQAIADGALVDVSTMAREAGLTLPTAVTQAAYADCIAWNEKNAAYQDVEGRLWDVLSMARLGLTGPANSDRVRFRLVRIPNTPRATVPRLVELVIGISGGDDGEPVLTIMEPNED